MYRYVFLALLPITSFATQIGGGLNVEKRQISLSIGLPTDSSSAGSSSTQSPSSGSDSSTDSSTTSSSTTSSSSTSTSATVTSTTSTITSTSTVRTTQSSSTSVSFSPSITSSQSPIVETYTTFVDGSMTVGTRTTNAAVAVTTNVPAGSGLATGENSNDSGLSSNSKKIIGGVVGGVGGALLVGALAFTAWRIWGKKNDLRDDDFFDPNANEAKLSSSTTDNTPFRSTLDQYHQPGPVNTASNF